MWRARFSAKERRFIDQMVRKELQIDVDRSKDWDSATSWNDIDAYEKYTRCEEHSIV